MVKSCSLKVYFKNDTIHVFENVIYHGICDDKLIVIFNDNVTINLDANEISHCV